MKFISKAMLLSVLILSLGCASKVTYVLPDLVAHKYSDGERIYHSAFKRGELDSDIDYDYEFIFIEDKILIEVDRITGKEKGRRLLSEKELYEAEMQYRELRNEFLEKHISF